jgi:hypothetical protein
LFFDIRLHTQIILSLERFSHQPIIKQLSDKRQFSVSSDQRIMMNGE